MATEPVTFRGGSWDGQVTDLAPGLRSCERRNPEGGHDVYVRSADTIDFVKTTKVRGGTREKTLQSTVFKFAGTK